MIRENKSVDAFSVMKNRKSVRNFSGRVIEKEKIDALLQAAMAVPSAVNMQPWAFIVVTDRTTLDNLCSGLPYAKMLDRAGAAIIVCAIPRKAHEQSAELAVIDSTCASENILLAVEALGLGAVWTAAYPYNDRMNFVRQTLRIPDDIIPLNVIPIGYPAGENAPIDKFNEKNIHRDKW